MKIMKKLLLGLVLVYCYSYQLNAQENNTGNENFDHWSIDLGAGIHQIGSTISTGYVADPLFQASFGVRYMFNEKFGLRLGLGYNSFSDTGNSLPFESSLYRASMEGVLNLGNVLDFHTWTKRLNLLAHVGAGVSSLNVIEPVDNGGDFTTLLNFGMTPQFKLSNKISLFLDISAFMNFNQEDNFDGGKNADSKQTNLNYINTSLGLSIALGRNKQSADFAQKEETIVYNELDEIKKRLDTAEEEIAGLKVSDSNINKTNLIYELDTRYAKKGEENKYANSVTGSNVNFIKELLNRGYVNVFFDTNKTSIQKESLSAVNYLRQFMNDNPYINASLIGFTDETGEEGYNQILSKKRAKAVYDILVDSGISPTRLTYGGVGEDKTMIKDAKQLARKVAFRIN